MLAMVLTVLVLILGAVAGLQAARAIGVRRDRRRRLEVLQSDHPTFI